VPGRLLQPRASRAAARQAALRPALLRGGPATGQRLTLTLTLTVTLTLTLTPALTLNPNPGQANALDLASPAAHEAEGGGKGGPSQLSQAGARQLRMATEAPRCREM